MHDNTYSISQLLNTGFHVGNAEKIPVINADDASITMYTSGTTGNPKEVRQRLMEFENDNLFIISKWGEEILKRKFCSTVSQHHIYGLLFSVLLPFTAGVPFRRGKIDFPEELEKLGDTQYMLITVPAFLKRAIEIKKQENLCLKSPWIFSSGGVLDPQTAAKTQEIFGFWPLEVYGSTETSGIAWRQSVNGPEWTPFDNAQLSANADGCLVIRSPYIKDPLGFETSDLVQLLEDGRFILKERIDSVVKIEEKRISVTEMENRILQSGFVSDVCVIPMEDRRQYLAAAVVFNEKGKERFLDLEKIEINTFWRDYLLQYFEHVVIPKKWRYPEKISADSQGKKMKDEIKKMFLENQGETSLPDGFAGIAEKITDRTENSVTLEFSVPEFSPYFIGHFPGFPILPAVAQVEIVVRFAQRYFGSAVALSQLKRVKFSSLIKPYMQMLLKLEKKDKVISFKISSLNNGVLCSSGTIIPEEQ